MRIPNKIKLGKHILQVKKVKPVGETYLGRLDSRKLEIHINTNYCKSMQEESLVHELLHATSVIYGLGLSEHQVTVLAEQLYSTLTPILEEK